VRINDEKPFDGHNTSLSRQYLHSLKGSNNQRHQSESRILETQQTKHNNDTISEPPDFSGHFVQGIENFAQDAHAVNRSGKFPEAQVPSDMDKRVRDTTMSGRQPRTFYLSSDAKSLSSQSMVLVNGVMSSKSRRQDLAVFEEKIIAAMDPSVAKAEFQKGADLSGQGAGTSSVSNERSHSNATVWPAARAGPGISVVERWPEAIDVDGIIRRQQDVDEIVTHLPDTILQEAQAKAINGTPLEAHIKFQPKPAKARRGENRLLAADFNPGEASHGAQDLQRQSDFVYDTYLRTNQPLVGSQLGSPMDIDQLDSIVDGKIGVLVIGEEDEAEWETYAEDEKSDKDWNSEDEDENGIFPFHLIDAPACSY
jgi:hypothetical protein